MERLRRLRWNERTVPPERARRLTGICTGCFRTEEGATDFLKIMSYTGTAKKQGIYPFHAILLALFGQASACW